MIKIPIVHLLIIVIALFLLPSGRALAGEAVSYGGDILYTKPVKSVLFSHKLHVEDKKLGCDMCHMKLFEMKALAAQSKEDFTMDALYKGKYCGACHNGKTAFASNTECARCHGGLKEAAAAAKAKPVAWSFQAPKKAIVLGAGDSAVNFEHAVHTTTFKCADCHAKLFALKKGQDKITMGDLYKGKYCGACHNGKTAFASTDCTKCHAKTPAPKAPLVYKVKDMGPVTFSHTFHTGVFSCAKCHPKIFTMKKTQGKMTMDAMNKGKQCGACHNGTIATSVTDCGKCHK
ncbi:MAG: cytochrome c3 family protein [Dissulfurispiraceae bacterium]